MSTIGDSPVTVTVSSSAADAKLGVDRRGDGGGQLDALRPDDAEAGEGEGQRVGARGQRHDAVLAGAVGDGRPDLFDKHRTRCFDSDTGEHGARCVAHHAGDRAVLRPCHRRHQQRDENGQGSDPTSHAQPPSIYPLITRSRRGYTRPHATRRGAHFSHSEKDFSCVVRYTLPEPFCQAIGMT